MKLSRNWVVSITTSETDPIVYGPYTRPRAEALAARLMEIIDARPREIHEHDWMHASAYPIQSHGIRAIRQDVGL